MILNIFEKINKTLLISLPAMKIIAYNKPSGIICTTEKIENNIIDAIDYSEKLIPIGRLDKDSEG